jgi:mono/diheme cytochrome c family protein
MIRWLTPLAFLATLTAPLSARPAHKQALAQYVGASLAKKLNDCAICHLPGGTEEERPHNLFGARLVEVKASLRKQGKPTTIEARLEAIFDEDTDSDGVGNLAEILAGYFPGDKSDRPTNADVETLKPRLAEFLRQKRGYAWKPLDPVKRPPLPDVKRTDWVRNPIDRFIAAEHEALGLAPRPEASRDVLLRRIHLDLVGLPPTAEELRAFRADHSKDAYERVVERLLTSKQYGERWGRHWMDVWRYSDWAGFGAQIRDSQPHIWRWRDWIVESLNEDKGYDRMLLEMLAGDELAPDDPRVVVATGYLVRNWKLLSREKWIQDTVEHTAQAFLGLTLQCAKCHDHMYDPILQSEYYQVRAIFETHGVRIDRVPGQPDTKKDGLARVYDNDLKAPTYFFLRGDDRTPDKNRVMHPAVPEALGGSLAIQPVPLPLSAYQPDTRAFVLADDIKASAESVAKAQDALKALEAKNAPAEDLAIARLDVDSAQARLDGLEARRAYESLAEGASRETREEVARRIDAAQRRHALAEAKKKLQAAENARKTLTDKAKLDAQTKVVDDAKKALAKLVEDHKKPLSTEYAPPKTTVYPEQSTGRRLAFARWLTARDNPLAARVAINHVWARHFGVGIVPTTNDFGRNGRPPSHPALLDWLAAEFMDSGWSMKALHRLIVTSAAYRLASTADEANVAKDRDNKYLWRFTPRRLEAEAVRDAAFYVAGRLDLTMGGPEFDFPLGLTVPRRSIYFRHAAEKQMEFLQVFDAPSVTECYLRKHSILPQQALALLNNEMTLKSARVLARKLTTQAAGDDAFVSAAFEQVLSRSPESDERDECLQFLQQQRAAFTKSPGADDAEGKSPSKDPAVRARENLVHVLLNHHEFVTIR